MRRTLITGVGGFLGQYIARELTQAGDEVIGLDRCDPPADHVTVAKGVDLPSAEMADVLAEVAPDVVVHAAGPASVPRSNEDPAADFRDSVLALQSVLEAVRLLGRECRVVFLSSAAVYGNPERLPISEELRPAPISPYGFHKLMAEQLIREYASLHDVPGCCLRIFSAYGPGLRRQVMWDICSKALAQPTVELLGSGHETRDFIHAADVARGVRVALERAAFSGEVYNLASGCDTSITQLAEVLVAALGCRLPIAFTGVHRSGDPLRWRADIGRLAGLGFCPDVSIDDGAGAYAKWFLEQAETPSTQVS